MSLKSINPTSGEIVDEYPEATDVEVEASLSGAALAWKEWSRRAVESRGELLVLAAGVLRGRREELARLMALEMGKPILQGRAEVDKCALVCEHYASVGPKKLLDAAVAMEGGRGAVTFRPLGAILAIMPWNFPLWQVFRFLAPNLLTGNVGLLKHAENVPGCGRAIQEIIDEAGFPSGVFTNLAVHYSRTERILRDPRVAAVTLTGSTRAGRAVAGAAGDALKKVVLELGGSDAYVVLEDADVELAARICVTSRMLNGGQTCISAKRWIVVDAVREAFTDSVVKRLKALRMGDPLSETTELGPMAREDLRGGLHDQVVRSTRAGARAVLGGQVPDGPGWFYPATLLIDVPRESAAACEETFGPVAALIAARDEADAIDVANGTPYGLGAAVFSQDVARGTRIARESLEAGACVVNDFVRSDPRLPFGGIRQSGFGRELGDYGLHEFANVKALFVADT